MRRFAIASAALLVVPVLALAGPVATEGNRTLQIKAKYKPATASKKGKDARPLKMTFDYVTATTDDSRIPDLKKLTITTGGPTFNFSAFPKCDETDAYEQGDSVCPEGSQVGTGTAVAEVHPPGTDTKQDFAVEVKAYNGTLDTAPDGSQLAEPKEGLLIYAEVAGSNVTLPFWALKGNKGVETVGPENDPDPEADALFSIKEVHLTFPKKTLRRPGHTVAFLGAPVRCKKVWKATATSEIYEGAPITAIHKAKCTKP